jgi:DNA-binding NtrC family response regulator
MMIRVLAVDDEEPFRRLLKKELTRKGFSVEVAAEGKAALAMLEKSSFHVLLLDVLMPGMDGLALMQALQGDPAAPPIVVLTGKATVETAVEAMKNGAYDYITKPYKLDELEIVIRRAHEYSSLRLKSELLQKELVRKESPVEMVGSSRPMRSLLALIRKIAPSDSTVLILGESGTGKELVANTLWHFSRRCEQPIVAQNCATLSESLMESELFGHEKGAFTTAYATKHGIVEVADGGTLFLDEIAEMPPALQAKLLRFLDTGEFRRVGSNRTRKVDVRLIAATNKDLKDQVVRKNFREDLFYRLNVIRVEVPPLRERREDIPELARHFIRKYARKMAKQVRGIDDAALAALERYDWPGNVRELENEMERALLLCDSQQIGVHDLSVSDVSAAPAPGDQPRLDQLEKASILKVLRDTGGNRSRASRILGINRKTLYLKLKKYGISGSSD